jgi:hypothetical protein
MRNRRVFHPDLSTAALEGRCLLSIARSTDLVKVPGPTDVVVVTATNPAGNHVPGQSSTVTLSNREARQLA